MSVPQPYEIAVLADLARMLGEIRTANGYHTDAGAHVYTAAQRLDPQDDAIFLVLDDAEEELREQNGYVRDVTLRVDVQIFVPLRQGLTGRAQARQTIHLVLADIRTAVLRGLAQQSFSVEHTDVRLEGRSILPVEAAAQWANALQPIEVDTREEFVAL